MKIDVDKMNIEERAMLELHELYRRHGYSRFRLGRFEEYELYRKNKDFISTEDIIVFSDLNGKLVALKPDLTLSIVKNYRHEPGTVQKVYYSENIYRIFKNSKAMREITQTGLECMGDLDICQEAEVIMLAERSLATITPEYVFEISHMGVVADVLTSLDEETKRQCLEFIGKKNAHSLRKLGKEKNIPDDIVRNIEKLIYTYGTWASVQYRFRRMNLGEQGKAALEEIGQLMDILEKNGRAQNVRIGFSIVNNMNYYSGLLFQGFVRGIPHSILSGGRYDNLMARNGKEGGALGFGVYLDDLEEMNAEEEQYDADTVLLYDKRENAAEVLRAAEEMAAEGDTVLTVCRIPENIKYRRAMRIENGKVREIE